MDPLLLLRRLETPGTDLTIVYTTRKGTKAALDAANSLSKDLEIRLRIVAIRVVPYHLEIDRPGVSPDFAVQQILSELQLPVDANVTIQYLLCRDQDEGLAKFLKPQSLVVVGGRDSLIGSREQRIARRLERMGHEVVFVPAG